MSFPTYDNPEDAVRPIQAYPLESVAPKLSTSRVPVIELTPFSITSKLSFAWKVIST